MTMESSSHGSESIHATPPAPLTQSTHDYDLPPPPSSSLELGENSSIEYSSIEILSSETERNDAERGRVSSDEPETQFVSAIDASLDEPIIDGSTTSELAASAVFTASTDEVLTSKTLEICLSVRLSVSCHFIGSLAGPD